MKSYGSFAKITASPPEEAVNVVYQGHKKAVEELRATATEWMKDLLQTDDALYGG